MHVFYWQKERERESGFENHLEQNHDVCNTNSRSWMGEAEWSVWVRKVGPSQTRRSSLRSNRPGILVNSPDPVPLSAPAMVLLGAPALKPALFLTRTLDDLQSRFELTSKGKKKKSHTITAANNVNGCYSYK